MESVWKLSWGCLEDVFEASDCSWSDPEYYQACKNVNRCDTSSIFVMLWNYCLFPSAINIAKNIQFWSVWKVSGGCLGDSGYCLGSSNVKSNNKIPMSFVAPSWFFFSQWPRIGGTSAWVWGVCEVSGHCLEGVLGCLGNSGYCLEDDSAKSID